ncbi:hypothetical protein D3C72_2105810 [compost metagenome]
MNRAVDVTERVATDVTVLERNFIGCEVSIEQGLGYELLTDVTLSEVVATWVQTTDDSVNWQQRLQSLLTVSPFERHRPDVGPRSGLRSQ